MRYGYRRVHVVLQREGWDVNIKKTHRIYNELGLQLRNKTPKRRVKAKLRDDRQPATRPNETWAMDFVHDQLATGKKIRVLTVVDTFSRFSPILDQRFSYGGEDVVRVLDQACAVVGYPKAIRVDQGSEFISRDLDLWAYQKDVVLDFSRPGTPTDNAFIESFNGKFRAECLNAHWFMSLDDAREKMEDWRRDYNEVRRAKRDRQQAPDNADKRRIDASRAMSQNAENSSYDWPNFRGRVKGRKTLSAGGPQNGGRSNGALHVAYLQRVNKILTGSGKYGDFVL